MATSLCCFSTGRRDRTGALRCLQHLFRTAASVKSDARARCPAGRRDAVNLRICKRARHSVHDCGLRQNNRLRGPSPRPPNRFKEFWRASANRASSKWGAQQARPPVSELDHLATRQWSQRRSTIGPVRARSVLKAPRSGQQRAAIGYRFIDSIKVYP
jgi:hypothetical protein